MRPPLYSTRNCPPFLPYVILSPPHFFSQGGQFQGGGSDRNNVICHCFAIFYYNTYNTTRSTDTAGMPNQHDANATPVPTTLQTLRELANAETPAAHTQALRHLLATPHNAGSWCTAAGAAADDAATSRLLQYVQHSTLKAFVDGAYILPDNSKVSLPTELADAAAHGSVLHTAAPTLLSFVKARQATVVSLSDLDVLSCAQQQTPAQRVKMAVLNSCNATTPGGGYKKGAPGNEEDLHRRSNVFSCLGDPQKRYSAHKACTYPLNTPCALFSPRVVVVRGGAQEGHPFLLTPYTVNVVSAPLQATDARLSKRASEVCGGSEHKNQSYFSSPLLSEYSSVSLIMF